MTYPADCQARSATVEALEGHLRSTPAISEPPGEAGAAAYEPFNTNRWSPCNHYVAGLQFSFNVKTRACRVFCKPLYITATPL